MTVQVKWRGDQELEKLRKVMEQTVRYAATLVQTRAKILCSRPAERIRRKRKRKSKSGKKGSRFTIFLGSKPGEPPMVRTSFGRRNILTEYNSAKKVARVGPSTNADYMAFLELGTDNIDSRPWLSKAMKDYEQAIGILFRATLRRVMGG